MSASLEGIAEPGTAQARPSGSEPCGHKAVTILALDKPVRTFGDPDPFNAFVCRDDVSSTVVLQGEFDLAGVSRFEELLEEIEEQESSSVVLDLRQLTFLDCSGLHSFIAAHRRITSNGRSLFLIPGPAPVQRLFELTQGDSMFQFVGVEAAV